MKYLFEDTKPILAYHGSTKDFVEFMHEFIGSNGDSYGPGFYFTSDKEVARIYGVAKAYYLTIARPINITRVTLSFDKLSKFLKALDPDGSLYLENYDDVYSNGITVAIRNAVTSLLDHCESDWDIVCDIYGGYSGDMKHFCKTVKDFIGDGISYVDNGGTRNYIVMMPNQIQQANIKEHYKQLVKMILNEDIK